MKFNIHITFYRNYRFEDDVYSFDNEDDARLLYDIFKHHVGHFEIDEDFVNSLDMTKYPESEYAYFCKDSDNIIGFVLDDVKEIWPEDEKSDGQYQTPLESVHITSN